MRHPADAGVIETIDRFVSSDGDVLPSLGRAILAGDPVFLPPRPGAVPCCPNRRIGPLPQESVDRYAVHELTERLLRQQPVDLMEGYLEALVRRGLSAEHIYLRVFEPVARRLGELWLDDACTFVDVTLATAALQSGMRYLTPHFHRQGRPARGRRLIVLATLDGDQHTFGAAIAAEFFRRDGWTVIATTADRNGALVDRLQGERNVVVGLSASRADQLSEVSAVIRQLRRLGQERLAGTLVGGPLFVERPGLAEGIGADAVGRDARHAVAEAEMLAAAGD